jgi:hypothetical protein
MSKYVRLECAGKIPFFLDSKTFDRESNTIRELTVSEAAALGFKPLVDNPPSTDNNSVARLTGYVDNGTTIEAQYEIVAWQNATTEELRQLVKKFDIENMTNYTKTDLLKIIAKLTGGK